MSRRTRFPAIPEGGEDAIQAIKEAIEVGLRRRGDPLEGFVTFRDLDESGFRVSRGAGGALAIGSPTGPVEGSAGDVPGGPIDIGADDLTPPPAPTGVRAAALSMSAIGVFWNPPTYSNHRYAEVFASRGSTWDHVADSFDASQPIGPGNQTPYFMGIAGSTLFVHSNLESTVPTIETRWDITSFSVLSGETRIDFPEADSVFSVGDRAVLTATDWDNSGFTGVVTQVSTGFIVISGEAPTGDAPTTGTPMVMLAATTNDLDDALNPDPIYYWVRFVSQANISGPVQSRQGVAGTVFTNPEQILNILTGRIRSSNLANELVAPIEYVRGPLIPKIEKFDVDIAKFDLDIAELFQDVTALEQTDTALLGAINNLETEVDNQGGRLTATEGFIGKFEDADLGTNSIAAWINTIKLEVTNQNATFGGFTAFQAAFDNENLSASSIATFISETEAFADGIESRVTATESFQASFDNEDLSASALATFISETETFATNISSRVTATETFQASFANEDLSASSLATFISETETFATGIDSRVTATEGFQASFNDESLSAESIATFISDTDTFASNIGGRVTATETFQASFASEDLSAATIASRLSNVEAEATATQAVVTALDTIEAQLQNNSGNNETVTGWDDILGRVASRTLVQLSDSNAIAHIGSTLTIAVDNQNVALNQIGQNINAAQVSANSANTAADGALAAAIAAGNLADDNLTRINNSITMQVQVNQGGVLTAAGFGIGLQGYLTGSNQPDSMSELVSTFAVSADQFAIMSALNQGRILAQIENHPSFSNSYFVFGLGSSSAQDGLANGTRVAFSLPLTGAPANVATALRGRTYVVVGSPTQTTVSGRVVSRYRIRTEDFSVRPVSIGATNLLNGQYAIFPEQNIPFVIDTATNTVAVRGKLVVDGLIRANAAQIDELAATDVFSQSIVNYGLFSSKTMIGEALATGQQSGWALKISRPDFGGLTDTVLEFSRWGTGNFAAPTPSNGTFPSFNPNTFPPLNGSAPTDTAFFLGTRQSHGGRRGVAYMRGSLLVDGEARIAALSRDNGHFLQVDQEFPILVAPLSIGAQPWMNVGPWDRWDYSTGGTRENRLNFLRQNAFFWVDRTGASGFNTPTKSIYINETPLEPPRGGGAINVITRNSEQGIGQNEGVVYVSASFYVAVNKFWPYSQAGYTVGLFLGAADRSYGTGASGAIVQVPSNRNGLRDPDGNIIMESQPVSGFTDTHFVIIRASGSSPNSYGAYQNWQSANNSPATGKPLYKLAEYYYHNLPDQRIIQGIGRVPAGPYKVIVAIVERFTLNGSRIQGAIQNGATGQNNNNVAIAIGRAMIMSQQVSTRAFSGTIVANTGNAGTSPDLPPGGGNTGDNSFAPGEPEAPIAPGGSWGGGDTIIP